MSDLHSALAMIRNNQITGEQTVFIDGELSKSSYADIPNGDVFNVSNYIDVQLAYNPVSLEVKEQLNRLHNELRQHRNNA